MAPRKSILEELQEFEGAVTDHYNPHATVIRTHSPSVNFTFGKGYGLPLGYTLILYGPPKAGKSLLCHSMIGMVHKDYPTGIAIKFDTEFREQGQMTPQTAAMFGVDTKRYVSYSVNQPALIFDRIEQKLPAIIEKGGDIKLVIIDSITGIQGRREANATSVDQQQIGDHALTIQTGLKRILPIQRKYNFAVVLTAHARAEMDQAEIMRGNKIKMAASFGAQHFAEYFMLVQPNKTAKGKIDIFGNKFVNENIKDINDHEEVLGHKIKVTMRDSSMGPKMRSGEFTFDYNKGFINTYEEVFLLGSNRGVIERPTQQTYVYKGMEYRGKPAILAELSQNAALCEEIMTDLRAQDNAGVFAKQDDDLAKGVAEPTLENLLD